jgi:hypothetical protein
MLTVTEIAPRTFEVTLEGLVDRADIERMEAALGPALDGDGPLGLVLRTEGWRDMTGDAMARDARFEFGRLLQWRKVARLAFVTDMQAFDALIHWVDPLVPMIGMRRFPSSDLDAARAFATAPSGKGGAAEADGGLRIIADGTGGVLAYEIAGPLGREDVAEIEARLASILEGDGRFDLYVRFLHWEGFDPALLTDGSLYGVKMGAIGRLGKYAVVGAPDWMRATAGMVSGLMPFNMRFFEAAHDAEAREWVGL